MLKLKEVAKFIYKNVRIITDKGKVIEGYFGDWADDEDVEVDTVIIDPDRNGEFYEGQLKPLIEVPYTEIKSIEVVE